MNMLKTYCVAAACAVMITTAVEAKPLKVYILAGQSNMQGFCKLETAKGMKADPNSRPLYDKLFDENGNSRVFNKIHIAAFSKRAFGTREHTNVNGPLSWGYGAALAGAEPPSKGSMGPEFAFGVTMHEALGEPILLIKTAWGGTSLSYNWRPPSAGAYVVPQSKLDQWKKQGKDIDKERAAHLKNLSGCYRMMVQNVHKVLADPKAFHPAYDPARGYEIAGFVWFQGWNDMMDGQTYPEGRFDAYTELLTHFIKDVRQEFKAPGMPVVIGGAGFYGKNPKHRSAPSIIAFRKAQMAVAQVPQFKGTVVTVPTEALWDAKLDALLAKKQNLGRTQRDLERLKKLNRDLERQKQMQAQLDSGVFKLTDADEKYIEENHSNAHYHYLGSVKVYCRMGEAFAKDMLTMMGNR